MISNQLKLDGIHCGWRLTTDLTERITADVDLWSKSVEWSRHKILGIGTSLTHTHWVFNRYFDCFPRLSSTKKKHQFQGFSRNKKNAFFKELFLQIKQANVISHYMTKSSGNPDQCISQWLGSTLKCPYQHIIGQSGDKSFQSITCIGTDKLTRTTNSQNAAETQNRWT